MKLGRVIPDLILKDHLNRDFRLYDNLDKWLILIFYKDNLALNKLVEYDDYFRKLNNYGIKIVVVNNASVETNRAYTEKFKIQIPLLSDEEGILSKQIEKENNLEKKRIFVLNNKAKIVYVDYKLPLLYLSKLISVLTDDKGT